MRRGEPRRRARLCTSVCVSACVLGTGSEVFSRRGGRASLPLRALECRARRCCAGAAGNAAGLPVASSHVYTPEMIRRGKLPYQLRAVLGSRLIN